MTLRLRSCEVVPALLVAAAGLLSAIAAVLLAGAPAAGPALWAGVALQTAATGLLFFIRRRPFAITMAVFAVAAVLVAPWPFLDGPTSLFYGSIDQWVPPALIVVGTTTLPDLRGRRAVLAFAGLAVVTVLAMRPWQPSLTYLAVGLLRTAAPTLIGLYVTARRRLVQALRDRAERAEREQLLIAERTRTEERTRMAAEMHDVVTHRLSLMVLQAGALRMTALDDATRRAAEELRSNGHQALEELRDLIGLLRAGSPAGAAASPPPADVPPLAALAAESESVGVPVELVEVGDPTLVSPVVARAVHRVLQEALTNVRKHAPGARVRVRVTRRADGVRLSVRNTAPTAAPDPALAASGTGAGLLGLRHQVELLGGTVSAGPILEGDGGFQVTAALPAYVPTGAAPPAATEAMTTA